MNRLQRFRERQKAQKLAMSARALVADESRATFFKEMAQEPWFVQAMGGSLDAVIIEPMPIEAAVMPENLPVEEPEPLVLRNPKGPKKKKKVVADIVPEWMRKEIERKLGDVARMTLHVSDTYHNKLISTFIMDCIIDDYRGAAANFGQHLLLVDKAGMTIPRWRLILESIVEAVVTYNARFGYYGDMPMHIVIDNAIRKGWKDWKYSGFKPSKELLAGLERRPWMDDAQATDRAMLVEYYTEWARLASKKANYPMPEFHHWAQSRYASMLFGTDGARTSTDELHEENTASLTTAAPWTEELPVADGILELQP